MEHIVDALSMRADSLTERVNSDIGRFTEKLIKLEEFA